MLSSVSTPTRMMVSRIIKAAAASPYTMAIGNRSLIELPDLNLECILLNLPLFSLLVCCSLSKSLFDLILKNQTFAKNHFAKSEPHLLIHSSSRSTFHLLDMNADVMPALGERVDVKPIFFLPLDYGYRVTHSCNGFVLMEYENTVDGIHKCIVSNPVRGQYTKLPETERFYRHVKCAFFYNPDDNQLKVLRLFISLFSYTDTSDLSDSSDSEDLLPEPPGNDSTFAYSEEDRMGELFVVGSDSWESIVTIPFCPYTIHSPCHLDKITHWLCCDDKDANFIVFFNFESHAFGNLTGPAHMVKTYVNGFYDMVLAVDHGRLSVIHSDADSGEFKIWRMNEYGNEDSWTLSLVIDTLLWNIPHDPFMSDENFVCLNHGNLVITCFNGRVFFCDLVNRTVRLVNHPPLQLSSVAVVVHTPSLISLSNAVGDGNLEVLKVPSRSDQPGLFADNYIELSRTYSGVEFDATSRMIREAIQHHINVLS